jgi:hypothetical protein
MTAFDSPTTNGNSVNTQGLLELSANEAPFYEWLKNTNCKGYTPARIIDSLSKASKLLVKRKHSDKSIWDIKKTIEFSLVHERAMKDKVFCVLIGHKDMPIFRLGSELYYLFLKEHQPPIIETESSQKSSTENEAVTECHEPINPDDVVAWLITRPNSNGTLYLERVVRSYMGTLRNAPLQLKLQSSVNRNVFACKFLAEFDELVETYRTAPNFVEINRTMGHGQFSAALAAYRRYLEHLENNANIVAPIRVREKVEPVSAAETIEPQTSNKSNVVDFSRPELCAQTKPLNCVIEGKSVVPTKQNWSQLLVALTEYFIAEGKPNLDSLGNKCLYGHKTFFLPRKTDFGTCALLSNRKWIYTNYNPPTIVTIIGNLCRYFEVSLDNVSILFVPKEGGNQAIPIQQRYVEECKPDTTNSAILDAELCSALDTVLPEKFSNGFTYSSPIQIGRIKKFVAEIIGKEISEADEAIVAYIRQSGTEFDGKIFALSAKTKQAIKAIADDYFEQGGQAIFYEAFFEKHEPFLVGASVISEDMLKSVFRKLYKSKYFCHETFFGDTLYNINVIITNEILRVWENDGVLSYLQIAERLPFIPYWRIKSVFGQNGDFVINRRGRGDSDGECIHISRIDISEEEKTAIRDAVEKQCNAHRYASLASIDITEIAERNFELSLPAMQTAAFQICCDSDRYERRGKIVTRKGENVDALYIMQEHCRTQDRVSLDELLVFELELTGEQHRWIPMQAAYDTMIRIDDSTYVADKFAEFDTNVIDNAIEHFMGGGEYISLQTVTTFAMFPYCGQAWNLFLLESYCRRFSPNFRFDTRSVNSKNVGAIVRKNSNLSYDDIMADSVAHSNADLSKQAVLNCLLDNGLISVRKHKDIESLIRDIRTKREGRN